MSFLAHSIIFPLVKLAKINPSGTIKSYQSTLSKGMTMKITINQLKTCPINSEIYRDSDVDDLVNSIGDVGLLQPVDNIPSHR